MFQLEHKQPSEKEKRMKKITKLLSISLLTIILLANSIVPAFADSNVHSDVIEVSEKVYAVTEDHETTIIDYSLIETKGVVVVDGESYTFEYFSKALASQAKAMGVDGAERPITEYLDENERVYVITPRYELWHQPPTTGYGAETYRGTFRDYRGVVLSMAGSAISLLGAFLGFNPETTKTIMISLLSAAGGVIGMTAALGSSANTRYSSWRSYHNHYPSMKYRNLPYVIALDGKETYGNYYYTYEWYSDPSGY